MNKLAVCRTLTKNANAAQLLYRIAYWLPKAGRKRDGLKWVANTCTWWCEQTGLSRDQYRRAITLLRRSGFVETKQRLYGGKCMTHVRFTDATTTALKIAPLDQCKSAPAGVGERPQPGAGKSAQLYKQGDTYTEILQKIQTQTVANAPVNSGKFIKKDTGEKTQEKNNEKNKTAGAANTENKQSNQHQHQHQDTQLSPKGSPVDVQIAAGASIYPTASQSACAASPCDLSALPTTSSPQPGIEPTKIATPAGLAAMWAEIVQKKYEDFVPRPKKRELAQLKQFISQCPPGQSAAILEICLSNWSDFTMKAKSGYGAYGLPSRPTIDFLLKYSTAAINFGLTEIKEKAEKEKKKSAAIAPSQQSSASTKAVEKPLTEEQIIAKMNGEPEMEVYCGGKQPIKPAPTQLQKAPDPPILTKEQKLKEFLATMNGEDD